MFSDILSNAALILYVDIFAVIFFHDALFIIALCLVLMYYLHLRRVYFGRSPAGLLPVFTSSADSSEWTFSATAQFLPLSPIGLAGLFASVCVRKLILILQKLKIFPHLVFDFGRH